MAKTDRKLEIYCRGAFNALNAQREFWDPTDEDIVRYCTKSIFYAAVFDCQFGKTGLVSEEARYLPDSERTWDHFNSPQRVGHFVMDKMEIYLNDYEKFYDIFKWACTQILVSKVQNRLLQQLTENVSGQDLKIFVPTDKKYEHVGIKLCKRPGNKGAYKNAIPTDETIPVPQEYLNWEKQFIV